MNEGFVRIRKPTRMIKRATILIVAASLAATACDQQPVEVLESTTTTIGAAGGVAKSADGKFELRVPQGALLGEQTIVIRTIRETVLPRQTSLVYEVTPSSPVNAQLELVIEAAANASIARIIGDEWSLLPTQRRNGVASAGIQALQQASYCTQGQDEPDPPTCGDLTCTATASEDCTTCAEDCGACPSGCGDGTCTATTGEDCATCAADCGACPVVGCGDGTCSSTTAETCLTCAEDCGACPEPIGCGDGTCTATTGESCSTCAADCGACAFCGDSYCTINEDCTNCALDCLCTVTSSAGALRAAVLWFIPGAPVDQTTLENFGPRVCNGAMNDRGRARDILDYSATRAAQDLGPVSNLPASITVPANLVPPTEVLEDLSVPPQIEYFGEFMPGSGSFASGVVIVYLDIDGDQQFDAGQPGNVTDRIVAGSGPDIFYTDVLHRVTYLNGTPYWIGDLSGTGGFLQQLNLPQGIAHYRRYRFDPPVTFPQTTPIEVAPNDGPTMTSVIFFQCSHHESTIIHDAFGPARPDTQIRCSEDSTHRYWSFSEEAPSSVILEQHIDEIDDCRTTARFGSACQLLTDPKPANWPCP